MTARFTTADPEAEIARLRAGIATPEYALAIEAVAADAAYRWGRENPDDGLARRLFA